MVCLNTMVIRSRHLNGIPVIGLLLIVECIMSIKLLELHVPEHVPLGTRAHLSCQWQLDSSDVLYSVKWYKDGKEFFRYVPRDLEPRRKFPLPGVDVEKSDETGENLTLSPAVLETGGRYRCEVSGEGPLFPTVSDHADMEIFVLPDHGPVLSGLRSRYRIGDHVMVNCTSGRSRPATRLTWYINGEPAPLTTVQGLLKNHDDGLITTSLILDFKVAEQHFKTNGIKVKCLATLAAVYWRSNEESALKEKNKIYGSIETRSLASEDNDTTADRVHANPARLLISSTANLVTTLFCSILCLRLY